MASFLRTLVVTILVVIASTPSSAQSPADPTGHWEGSITAPFGEIPIALDIARRGGTVIATFSRQDGSVTGFPLSDIEASGSELKMTMKANGGGVIRGSIAGATITGTFAAFAGTAPFEVKRTGDARFAPPVVNRAVSTALEGTWTARLTAGAESTTLRMTLTNHADGTATGTIADEHGSEVPVKFAQNGARVTIEIPTARGTFTGTLGSEGTALEGNYVEGALNVPVIFSKAK
jgi:hypothetical protein